MLWLCVRLPLLPLEVFPQQQQSEIPFIIEEKKGKRRLVLACNEAAKKQGITNNMTIATAQNLSDIVQAQERQTHLEHKIMNQLCIWAYQFSPHISFYRTDRFLIEISRCLRLFGGLDAFLQKFHHSLKTHQYSTISTLGLSPSEASLYSQCQNANNCQRSNNYQNALDLVDIRELEYDEKILEKVQGVGIKIVGDLLDINKKELGKRYGLAFIHYLDHLTGARQELPPVFQLPSRFSDEIHFADELSHTENLLFPLKRLLNNLCHYLLARQIGVKKLELILHYRQETKTRLTINFSQACLQFDTIFSLCRLKLENLELGHSVLVLKIKALVLAELKLKKHDLFTKKIDIESRDVLIEKLQGRISEKDIHIIRYQEDFRPEHTYHQFSVLQPPTKQPLTKGGLRVLQNPRPLWLLKQAKPLKLQLNKPYHFGPLTLLTDAERIETGWWDNKKIRRDYFIAKHPQGDTYWIFKDYLKSSRWFLHGFFS